MKSNTEHFPYFKFLGLKNVQAVTGAHPTDPSFPPEYKLSFSQKEIRRKSESEITSGGLFNGSTHKLSGWGGMERHQESEREEGGKFIWPSNHND